MGGKKRLGKRRRETKIILEAEREGGLQGVLQKGFLHCMAFFFRMS